MKCKNFKEKALTTPSQKKRSKPLKLASVFFRFLAFCVSQITFLKERLNYSYFFLYLSSAFRTIRIKANARYSAVLCFFLYVFIHYLNFLTF
uniref:Uncharacterized protein n=1 Tax=Helicobacter pylori TaxID=210 RepID=A0A060D055_HELPX|nr:hypothetical protein 175_ICEHptfs4b_39 [Helicobacter pylori]